MGIASGHVVNLCEWSQMAMRVVSSDLWPLAAGGTGVSWLLLLSHMKNSESELLCMLTDPRAGWECREYVFHMVVRPHQ